MKKFFNFLLWAFGFFTWFFLLFIFWMADLNHGRNTHLVFLIITGICIVITLLRNNKIKQLESENAELKKKLQEVERKAYIESLVDGKKKAD